jgi:hypothetical protein
LPQRRDASPTWLGEPASVVDGKMIKRWCAAGMLNAERRFRRLKGYRQMPRFVAALARHLEAVPSACDAARVA